MLRTRSPPDGLALCLRSALGPLPQSSCHGCGEPMTQLTRHQDNLSSMMTLVSDEIGKDMPDVRRQIPPRIRPRGRDASAVLTPELEQAVDPAAASAQAFCQFP